MIIEKILQFNILFKSSTTCDDLKKNEYDNIFNIPWGHHRYIMDKCENNMEKAVFYINKIIENGWSRSVLLNFFRHKFI